MFKDPLTVWRLLIAIALLRITDPLTDAWSLSVLGQLASGAVIALVAVILVDAFDALRRRGKAERLGKTEQRPDHDQ